MVDHKTYLATIIEPTMVAILIFFCVNFGASLLHLLHFEDKLVRLLLGNCQAILVCIDR